MLRSFVAFALALLAIEAAGLLAAQVHTALLPFFLLEPRVASSGSLLFAFLAGVCMWELFAPKDERWNGFTRSHRSLVVVAVACLIATASAAVATLFHTGEWSGTETNVLSVFGLQELGVILMQAASEELLNRYLLIGVVTRFTHSRMAGVLVATVVFWSMHGRGSPTYFIAAGGLWFAAIFVYTGSIWSSIAAHFFTNVVILGLFSTSPLAHPILLGRTEQSVFQFTFANVVMALSLCLLWKALRGDPLIQFSRRSLNHFNQMTGGLVGPTSRGGGIP